MHRADRQLLLTSVFVLCTLIVTLATMFAHADHYYVAMGGTDDNNTGRGESAGDPWRTITWAMDNVPTDGEVANPHIIHVAPGTYTYTTGGSDNETFPISWSNRMLEHVWVKGDDRDTTIVEFGDWKDDHEDDETLGIFEAIGFAGYLDGVTISTLTIRDGYSFDDGSGVYVARANVTVHNCLIKGGHSEEYGGGLNAGSEHYGAGDLVVTGCTIQGNEANFGGGISAKYGSTLDVVNCLIYDNEAFWVGPPENVGGDGGGIYMSGTPDGTCLIQDCDILENKADWDHGHGGGIYLKDSSPHIAHNNIRATSAYRYTGPGNIAYEGGGLYMTGDSDPLIDEWNEIAENRAKTNGGGLYANGPECEPTILYNEFFYNKALSNVRGGGAIFGYKSKFHVENNYIHLNYAYKNGGGIYCYEDSAEESAHSVFGINWISSNEAGDEGGGVYFLNGYSRSEFANNNVWANIANRGGGLCLANSVSFWVEDNAVWDNSADDGSGIYVSGGSATLFNNLVFSSDANDDQEIGIQVYEANLEIKNLTIAHHADCGISAVSGNVWIWDSIIWGNATSIDVVAATVEVFYTDIEGGWTGVGSDNIDEDPLFVPWGGARGWPVGYFLSQTEAGQGTNSPCVDAGSQDASSSPYNPLSDYSTRTDAVYDSDKLDMGYHYLHEGATFIELDSFEAKGLNGKVLVAWTTGTEIDNAGFDIYRKEEGETDFVKVNASLIPAQGSLGGGASYSFVDANVESGTKYLYYLVDIDTSGKTTAHGPVSATPFSLDLPSLHHGSDGELRHYVAPMTTKLSFR